MGQATLQSEGCLGARAFLAAILCRLAGGAWNLPLLLQNYALVWAFRMQTRMLGAPRCDGILDVQNYHAGMCAAGGDGLNDGGSALRGRDRVCCCHSRLMTPATQAGGQLVFAFRLCSRGSCCT